MQKKFCLVLIVLYGIETIYQYATYRTNERLNRTLWN